MSTKMSWESEILTITIWILFLGGLFGFVASMYLFLAGKTPAEYGTTGLGAGAWLLASAIVVHLKGKHR